MNQSTIGSFAVIGAALLWSLDGFLRQQLYSLPPSVVVFWEHLLGLVVLLPLLAWQWDKFKQLTRKQWLAITFVAFLSGALGTILYTAALGKINYIQFSVVVLLQQTQPLFAIGAAVGLLHERLTKRLVALAVLGLIGAYLVSFPSLTPTVTAGQGTVIAALMALGAAASWGISTALSKFSLRNTSLLHITTARFVLTSIFALLFTVILGQQQSLVAISVIQWQYLAAITLSTGGLALFIYYFGLQRVPASHSTLLELTWPLSAVVIGYVFLHDRLTPTQLIGAILLVTTMTLVSRSARRETTPEPYSLKPAPETV